MRKSIQREINKNKKSGVVIKQYGGNGLYKTKVRRGYKVDETYLFYKSNYKIYNFIIRLWFLFHHWLMTKRLSYLRS